MGSGPGDVIYYKRSRFSARLFAGRRYTRSHCWLEQQGEDLWHIGLTRFATRMLGDLVEYSFGVKQGEQVTVGEVIGWVEGFKALTDLYCVMDGEYSGLNPELERDITLMDHDPHGKGWFYKVRGEPDPDSVDVQGYIAILDATIDRMLQTEGAKDDG